MALMETKRLQFFLQVDKNHQEVLKKRCQFKKNHGIRTQNIREEINDVMTSLTEKKSERKIRSSSYEFRPITAQLASFPFPTRDAPERKRKNRPIEFR